MVRSSGGVFGVDPARCNGRAADAVRRDPVRPPCQVVASGFGGHCRGMAGGTRLSVVLVAAPSVRGGSRTGAAATSRRRLLSIHPCQCRLRSGLARRRAASALALGEPLVDDGRHRRHGSRGLCLALPHRPGRGAAGWGGLRCRGLCGGQQSRPLPAFGHSPVGARAWLPTSGLSVVTRSSHGMGLTLAN